MVVIRLDIRTNEKLMIFIMAALFLVIVAMLFMNSTQHSEEISLVPSNLSGNFSFNESILANNSLITNTSSLGKEDFVNVSTSQNMSLNCTPLGNLSVLMIIGTKYLLMWGNNSMYVKYTLGGISRDGILIKADVSSRIEDRSFKSEETYLYGLDGRCIRAESKLIGYESMTGRKSNVRACSGYPLWVVCSEYIPEQSFVRTDNVVIRGKTYQVNVYRNGTNEFWVGTDLPLLFKYSVGNGTDKSFYVELLDVEGIR